MKRRRAEMDKKEKRNRKRSSFSISEVDLFSKENHNSNQFKILLETKETNEITRNVCQTSIRS